MRAKYPSGLTKARLEQEYWANNRRQHEIAKMFDVSTMYISKKMKQWGIAARGPRERAIKTPLVSKEYLEAEYHDKSQTMVEIAASLPASVWQVARWMDYYGIPRRKGGAQKVLSGVLTEAVLRREYWENGKSLMEIAEGLGVNPTLPLARMQEFGIPRRSFSEANKPQWTEGKRREKSRQLRALWQTEDYRAKMTGANAPMWNGGTSNEPYPFEFDKALKRRIRQRDGYTCAVCRLGAKSVHHIDYDKSNSDEDNLITLCRSCHSETNHSRDVWEEVLVELRAIDSAIAAGGLYP